MRKQTLIFFILLGFLITTVQATELFIETDGASHFLSVKSDNPLIIKGYLCQINFSDGIQMTKITPLQPFTGNVNINNNERYAKMYGINFNKTPANRLALLEYSGNGKIEILVDEIYDSNNNEIELQNAKIDLSISEPVLPALPDAIQQPRSISPMSVGTSGPGSANPSSHVLPPESGIPDGNLTIRKTSPAPTIRSAENQSEQRGQIIPGGLSQQSTETQQITQIPRITMETPSSVTTHQTPLSFIVCLISLGCFCVIMGHKRTS